MNKKILVLAFVSAAFFFGCSADGSTTGPTPPGWDAMPPKPSKPNYDPVPPIKPNNPVTPSYCLVQGYCLEIGDYPIETTADCLDYDGTVVSSCPN